MRILSFLKVQDLHEVDGTQFYRQVSPLKTLNKRAEDMEVVCLTSKVLEDLGLVAAEQAMAGFDVYSYPRMTHEDCEAFLDLIHSNGALLTIDADDDLTEDYKLVSGRGEQFKTVLSLVDHVTVSTPALADHFAHYTKEAPTVLLNHVDVAWMQSVAGTAQRLIEGTAIGFSGSPTHWGDWRLPAVPLQRICRDFPVTALLHGDTPYYLKYVQENVVRIDTVPYHLYPVVLKQFDILLCAVDSQDKFNSGKSAVKALEAMAIGVVPICSRFSPYQALLKAGAPIIIIREESQDGWYEAMASLVKDPGRIAHLQSLGPDWVRENRDINTGYKQWQAFYERIGPAF